MVAFAKSGLTAGVLVAAVLYFAARQIAPALPPFVGPPDFEETRSLNLPSAKRLVVVNEDGAVRIETRSAGGIAVSANIRLYGGSNVPESALRDYAAGLVAARHSEGTLEIVSEPGERIADTDLAVVYEISVPPGTDIDVVGSNGNVWIAEGCGRVAVHGGNSDIEIHEPLGIVIAKSANGRIKLVNARQDATLEAVNGSIFADMQSGMLDASTTNGHIIARLLNAGVDGCDLVSNNGSITIEFAADRFGYDVRTGRGILRSDFALPGESAPGVLDTKHAQGAMGGGASVDIAQGPFLTAHALNGNIWLKRN